jgi:hypothetical protein
MSGHFLLASHLLLGPKVVGPGKRQERLSAEGQAFAEKASVPSGMDTARTKHRSTHPGMNSPQNSEEMYFHECFRSRHP